MSRLVRTSITSLARGAQAPLARRAIGNSSRKELPHNSYRGRALFVGRSPREGSRLGSHSGTEQRRRNGKYSPKRKLPRRARASASRFRAHRQHFRPFPIMRNACSRAYGSMPSDGKSRDSSGPRYGGRVGGVEHGRIDSAAGVRAERRAGELNRARARRWTRSRAGATKRKLVGDEIK